MCLNSSWNSSFLNGNQGQTSAAGMCKHEGVCATGKRNSPEPTLQIRKRGLFKAGEKITDENGENKMGRIKRKDRERWRVDHIWYKMFCDTDTRQAKRIKIYVY